MNINTLSAGTLTGDTVRNPAGDELGTVEEIMIDLDSGGVAYLVLAAGGFLGMGEKYFAIPWSMVTVDLDEHEAVIDVDKATIENAPGFDRDNWPDSRDMGWISDVYQYYGQTPFWQREREGASQ